MPDQALEWLRKEKEHAWNEGYAAATNRRDQSENPYIKKEQ